MPDEVFVNDVLVGARGGRPAVALGPEIRIDGRTYTCTACLGGRLHEIPEGQPGAGIYGQCRVCLQLERHPRIRLEELERRRLREREELGLRPAMIRNYTYKPRATFFGRSASSLFFGIEHEVECKPDAVPSEIANQIYKAMGQQQGLFYFKADGSIRHGFEIVTHPMSFNYAMKHWPMAAAEVISNNCLNHWGDDYNCGVHIHMSRDAFGPAGPIIIKKGDLTTQRAFNMHGFDGVPKIRPAYHLYKFMQFIYKNPDLVKFVAGREAAYINGHEMASYNKEEMARYVRRNKNGDDYIDADRGLKEVIKGRWQAESRYVAVNLQNEHTVELRIFRSTTNHRRLRAYIQFADALFYYSKKRHLYCKYNANKQMSATGFEEYIRTHPARYDDLIEVFNNNPALAV